MSRRAGSGARSYWLVIITDNPAKLKRIGNPCCATTAISILRVYALAIIADDIKQCSIFGFQIQTNSDLTHSNSKYGPNVKTVRHIEAVGSGKRISKGTRLELKRVSQGLIRCHNVVSKLLMVQDAGPK